MNALDDIRERVERGSGRAKKDRARLLAALDIQLAPHYPAPSIIIDICMFDAQRWPCSTMRAVNDALETES